MKSIISAAELRALDTHLSTLESAISSTAACEDAALRIATLTDAQLQNLPDSFINRLQRQAGRITIFAGVECA